MQGGLVAHTISLTPSSGLGETTATAAGLIWPIAALFVTHDAFASLPPLASHSAKLGSVSMRLDPEDTP